MERFAVIIPDRGDRPELTDFCFKQISRMSIKPDKIFHINHKPLSGMFDLVDRVKNGVSLAKEAGFDLVFIIENDDWYPYDYFEKFKPGSDFYGAQQTVYYNVRNRSWNEFTHLWRSSLFCTGFRISAMDRFTWPDNTPFLDIRLWEYARRKKYQFVEQRELKCVGIKHNLGLCAGKGHRILLKNHDPNFEHLSKLIDDESLQFYKSLIEKYQTVKA